MTKEEQLVNELIGYILFDEYGIWWIDLDDVIDIEEAQPDMQSVKADRKDEQAERESE